MKRAFVLWLHGLETHRGGARRSGTKCAAGSRRNSIERMSPHAGLGLDQKPSKPSRMALQARHEGRRSPPSASHNRSQFPAVMNYLTCAVIEPNSQLVIAIVAGALAIPPTITTTGRAPVGVPAGTVTLICVTPTSPQGMPMKSIVAVVPPITTDLTKTSTPVPLETMLGRIGRWPMGMR
jgi:hypothetical protein